MRIRKAFTVAGVLLATAIGGVALRALLATSPGVTWATFSRIERGMPIDQVKAMFGDAKMSQMGENLPYAAWKWEKDRVSVSVITKDGIVGGAYFYRDGEKVSGIPMKSVPFYRSFAQWLGF